VAAQDGAAELEYADLEFGQDASMTNIDLSPVSAVVIDVNVKGGCTRVKGASMHTRV
jgi:hypothetical protein